MSSEKADIAKADLPLNQNSFMLNVISELSYLLQEVIGFHDAEGFISVIGQKIGDDINKAYQNELVVEQLTKPQIAEVLCDLKKRIGGGFYIIELDEQKVVLGSNVCPFKESVKGRPSLCMMTSNVFGTITADHNGYAKVILNQTIAADAPQCTVTVYFNECPEAEQAEGKEYFKLTDE